MAFTVSHQFITLYDMESLTGWTGPASLTLNTEMQRQGTACIGWTADTVDQIVWGPTFPARDITSPSAANARYLLFWINVVNYRNLATTNEPVKLYVRDANGNYGYWRVGEYYLGNVGRRIVGGWQQLGVFTAFAPDVVVVGTSVDLTQVVQFGFSVVMGTASTQLVPDVFIDWMYMDSAPDTGQLGVVVTGANNTDGEALPELQQALENAGIGYVIRKGNAFMISGKITIGTTDGVTPTRFVSRGYPLQKFTISRVANYADLLTTSATGSETVIQFGDKLTLGTELQGIDGPFIGGSPFDNFQLYARDLATSGGLYGVNAVRFNGWGRTSLDNANFELISCRMNVLGRMTTANNPVINNCIFYNGDQPDNGVLDFNTNITNCTFVNNQGALAFNAVGSYTLDNIKFYGNTYDIINKSGGDITIYATNGSNPDPLKVNNVNGGSVTIINSVTVSVTCYEAANPGTVIQGARVLLKAGSGGPLPYQVAVSISNDGAGTATVTHNNHGFSTGDYVVIEGAAEPEYNKLAQITVVDATTYTYTIATIAAGSATGSPTATAVVLYGTTDSTGSVVDNGFNYSSDQPVEGWARKTTSAPRYKEGVLGGTVTLAGLRINSYLVSDE